MRCLRMFALVFTLGLLAACTPAATDTERVAVDQFAGEVSYYPQETGATWSYLSEGSSLESTPLIQRVEGPTVLNNDIWIGTSIAGVGLEGVRYRQYRPDGVFLLMETAPGVETTHNPPIQEFPAPDSLRVGQTWGGDTTTTVFFPSADEDEQTQVFEVNYVYTVVDKRMVNLQSGSFEVFVINMIGRNFDDMGNEAETISQEIWFAPYIGHVRTREGLFLVDTNVVGQVAAE